MTLSMAEVLFQDDNGAAVGDMFTSLIYTCELSGVNPRNYSGTKAEVTKSNCNSIAPLFAPCPLSFASWLLTP